MRYHPLTRDQLRTIYDANPVPAVRRLPWEIHRLRAGVLRANDLVRAMDRFKGQNRLDPGSELALIALREAQDKPVLFYRVDRRSCRWSWALPT
jgi:hypothetical protein